MTILSVELAYYVGNQRDDLALQKMRVAFERADFGMRKLGKYLFPRLIGLMEKEASRQFKTGGAGPNRAKWAALTEPYRTWKAKRYPGKPILVRTETLKQALTESSSPFAERSFSDESMTFGTKGLPYASFPQTGTVRMVSRPPLDFTESFEKAVRRESLAAAREVMEEARLGEFGDFSDDRDVQIGPRGGRYYLSDSGRKVYL